MCMYINALGCLYVQSVTPLTKNRSGHTRLDFPYLLWVKVQAPVVTELYIKLLSKLMITFNDSVATVKNFQSCIRISV